MLAMGAGPELESGQAPMCLWVMSPTCYQLHHPAYILIGAGMGIEPMRPRGYEPEELPTAFPHLIQVSDSNRRGISPMTYKIIAIVHYANLEY